MNYQMKLKRNVWMNNMYHLIKRMDFTQGIWMIYLAYKGLSLLEIGIVESIFHITTFVMEVPTGTIADLYGRKTSRILGGIIFFISVYVLLIADTFWGFAFAFVLTALGYNLESGAGEALLYDSLKELDRTSEFMKYNGQIEIAMQLSGLVALPVGGYLATRNYSFAIGLTMVTAFVSILISLFFEEPKTIERSSMRNGMINSMKKQIAESFELFKKVPMTGYLIIVMQLFSLFYTTVWFYIQNYYKTMHLTEFQIGLILAAAAVLGASFAALAHRVEAVVKPLGILKWIPFIAVACYWGIALKPLYYGFFVILAGLEGMYYVVLSDYLNRFIPSSQRATVLSFGSMCFSAMMIFLFPGFGYLGDVFGLSIAFYVMAITATVILLGSSLLLINRGEAEKKIVNQQRENEVS